MRQPQHFMTGKTGHLGTELSKLLPVVSKPRSDCNILDIDSLRKCIQPHQYSAIIHLAAYTDQVKADQERLLSYQTNVIGTRNVAQVAKEANAKLFFISTDYVFCGKSGNYLETDIPSPANWYGYTKYAAELEIAHQHIDYCIIRTSFRPSLWNFPTAYTNVLTSADYTDIIASHIADCINQNISGIIHVGTPVKSFYELAKIRNPNIKPEVCQDPLFPKKRFLNIDKWHKMKA